MALVLNRGEWWWLKLNKIWSSRGPCSGLKCTPGYVGGHHDDAASHQVTSLLHRSASPDGPFQPHALPILWLFLSVLVIANYTSAGGSGQHPRSHLSILLFLHLRIFIFILFFFSLPPTFPFASSFFFHSSNIVYMYTIHSIHNNSPSVVRSIG